jgi:hypothetical protein
MQLAAHLFVTDIDRAKVPLVGDTRAEQTENFRVAIGPMRDERLADVMVEFGTRWSEHIPCLADEEALSRARSIISAMAMEGLLVEQRLDAMLRSVAFAPNGTITAQIVTMFGEVLGPDPSACERCSRVAGKTIRHPSDCPVKAGHRLCITDHVAELPDGTEIRLPAGTVLRETLRVMTTSA